MNEITLPYDFYQNLYNEIMSQDFEPENEDDTTCDMEFTIGKFQINLCATFEVNVIDESFSHEFGIEERWGIELGELEGISGVQVLYYDETTGYEADVTELFDETRFWNQFKRYWAKVNDIDIHHGDEVVVMETKHGTWKKMVYLYTDTRLRVYVCTPSIRSKYIRKHECKYMLPATTGALAILGKGNIYLMRNA